MTIEIANRLQKLRKEKGYSQEQLAEALGISRQAISKWERAEASPDTDNLICLAKLYGISLDNLLNLEEYNKNTNNIDDKKQSKKNITELAYSILPLIIVILYLIIGFFFSLWHPGWIIFLYIPIIPSLIDAIKNKNINLFNFPIFITSIYLMLGFCFHLWHPFWFLFILIPIYYPIGSFINHKKDRN